MNLKCLGFLSKTKKYYRSTCFSGDNSSDLWFSFIAILKARNENKMLNACSGLLVRELSFDSYQVGF